MMDSGCMFVCPWFANRRVSRFDVEIFKLQVFTVRVDRTTGPDDFGKQRAGRSEKQDQHDKTPLTMRRTSATASSKFRADGQPRRAR